MARRHADKANGSNASRPVDTGLKVRGAKVERDPKGAGNLGEDLLLGHGDGMLLNKCVASVREEADQLAKGSDVDALEIADVSRRADFLPRGRGGLDVNAAGNLLHLSIQMDGPRGNGLQEIG
jgi:hypothetical protein